MIPAQQRLVDAVCAACDGLASGAVVTLEDADRVAAACAMLRPVVADASTAEKVVLQNVLWCAEELTLTTILRNRYVDDSWPEWLAGDLDAERAAWRQARAELAQIRDL